MGFYPPDSLIHEAQRKHLTILPPNVIDSDADCTVTPNHEIRIGLNYIKGIQTDDIERLITARRTGGPFQSPQDLAARAAMNTTTLEALAWSGACDTLAGNGPYARRTALWQLGIVTPAKRTPRGDQIALDLPLARAPDLPGLTEWEQMIANYTATTISIEHHPLGLLRKQLDNEHAVPIATLATIRHNTRVKVGGFVIARQKPGTAKGITFLLLEDEGATLNVIVPVKLFETHRLIVRTEPLILIDGILERHDKGGGQVNLLAKKITRLTPNIDAPTATVRDLRPAEEPPTTTAEDFSVAAPAVMNFGRGRGR
jgi:error-prone DNA polymerase